MMCLKYLLLLLNVALLRASPVFFIENGQLQSEEKKTEISEALDIYRLTDEVTPVSYDLKMVPDLEKFTFRGNIEIEVSVHFTTNRILLHSKQLKIISCQVYHERGYLVKSTHKLEEINELLIIETEQSLPYDTHYTLKIEFEGVLNDDMQGFYRSSYKINDKKYWLAVTQFETSSAREAFPCFDEPRYRTPFKIAMAHYDNENAVSNMPYQTRSSYKDPSVNYRVWTRFQTTPPMATYLVAFMVSQFTYVSNDNKMKVYIRPDAEKQGSYALQQGTSLQKQMEGYIGIPHKMPKLDIVALPDFDMGAMENWGMTTYRERFVLVDNKPCSSLHKSLVTKVIAHEFAHQWFGDLVTPAWWDYLWLNEGFARFYEYFLTGAIEPTWDMDKFFVIREVQSALYNEIGTQRAMTTSVTQKPQLDAIFDVISYSKAASVIRMFEHVVSPNVFKSALQKYLRNGVEKKYGTVVPEDLFNAFAEQVHFTSPPLPEHVSISEIMKSWTENIGYPLIIVSRCYHHGHVTITQTTYNSSRAPKSLPEQKWIVPLTYTTKSQLKFSNTKPTQWSQADKRTLPETVPNSDWILFNLQQAGYYRVNYDSKNWHLLIDQLLLEPEKIHVLNRAQLIDDSFALAEDDKINYHVPLSLIQYLPKEKDIFPWITAVTALNRLIATYDDTLVGPFLKTFIHGIIEHSNKNFEFYIKETDSHTNKSGKPIFFELACKIGNKYCIDKAAEEYNKNKNDLNGVEPNFKKVVFCSALRDSEDKQNAFDNLWKLYTRSDVVNDKIVILESLSCVKDENIVKKILNKLIDSKNEDIRKQDQFYIYRYLTETLAINGAIEFLQEKTPKLPEMDNYGISVYGSILNKIKANTKTEQQITMLKELEQKCKTLDQAKYGYLTSSIKDAQNKGSNRAKANAQKARILLPIVSHILNPDTADDTNNEKAQTTTASPTSGAVILVSSMWINLIIFGVFIRYGLPLLHSSQMNF